VGLFFVVVFFLVGQDRLALVDFDDAIVGGTDGWLEDELIRFGGPDVFEVVVGG